MIYQNIRYYFGYQAIYVFTTVLLTSLGVFFHFLLDHEISIIEAWIHNNHWEILITGKLLSLFLLNRWFKIKLYKLKSLRQMLKELVKWPDPQSVVISIFVLLAYLSLGKVGVSMQGAGYWTYHLTSFIGLFLYFGIEFVVIAYLDDILNEKETPPMLWLGFAYTFIFTIAFRLSTPDYYKLLPHVIFCYSTLMYLAGQGFRSWSNAICFLVLFIAPMGAIFGLDPVWGDDFSLFHLSKKLSIAFLAAIWVISLSYFKFREAMIVSVRKLWR